MEKQKTARHNTKLFLNILIITPFTINKLGIVEKQEDFSFYRDKTEEPATIRIIPVVAKGQR